MKTDAPKTHRGVYYFPTRRAASDWAAREGWPTDRLIQYERGWAVQACESGRYAGPGEPAPLPGETWSTAPIRPESAATTPPLAILGPGGDYTREVPHE